MVVGAGTGRTESMARSTFNNEEPKFEDKLTARMMANGSGA